MSIEIIYLVIAIFSGESLVSIKIHNYSEFSPAGEKSCESYVGSKEFRKSLGLKGIKAPRVRAACLGSSQLSGFEAMVGQATSWKEVALQEKADVVFLTGKIRYTPIEDRRKSVESYLGRDLMLVTSDGEHALYASESVTQAELIKRDGKKTKLRAVFEDLTPTAGSEMQYPTDGKGMPLKRVGYRVIAIE